MSESTHRPADAATDLTGNSVRKGWVAFLFSFFNPGLGHLYAGNWKRGVAWYVISMIASIFALYAFAAWPSAGLVTALLALLVLPLAVGFDGYLVAKRAKYQRLKRFQRWDFYVAYFLITFLLISPALKTFIKHGVSETFEVLDDAMAPSLRAGDAILALKRRVTGNDFGRGEIVVLGGASEKDGVIARIIAVAGESIEVRRDKVLVNDAPLCEPYARWTGESIRTFQRAVVPVGSVFVLVDKRDAAPDSRSFSSPFVSLAEIHAQAQTVYWSSTGDFKNVGVRLYPPPAYSARCDSPAPTAANNR